MCKNFRAHIIFDFGTHHMSVIADIKTAVAVDCHQKQQAGAQIKHGMQNHRTLLIDQIVSDIAHNQRNGQRDCCRYRCKKHIGPEQPFVWFVIRD